MSEYHPWGALVIVLVVAGILLWASMNDRSEIADTPLRDREESGK